MKLKKIVSFFCIIFLSTTFYSKDVLDRVISDIHQIILSEYSKIKTAQKPYDHILLQEFFKKATDVDPKYLKKLEQDILKLKKIIKTKKKNKEAVDQDSSLLEKLQEIQIFLKKYRLQMDIVSFHSSVKNHWGDLMQAVDKGEDILPILSSKGISKEGIKGLKIFINKMNKVLKKAEEYETRLHADWIDLKLINYVVKIELIRLRNAAIFHPLYQGTPIVTNYPR